MRGDSMALLQSSSIATTWLHTWEPLKEKELLQSLPQRTLSMAITHADCVFWGQSSPDNLAHNSSRFQLCTPVKLPLGRTERILYPSSSCKNILSHMENSFGFSSCDRVCAVCLLHPLVGTRRHCWTSHFQHCIRGKETLFLHKFWRFCLFFK